jgi:hypothetical protein
MKLVGQTTPSTRSELILGWIGLVVVGAFLLPWIVMAVGCVLAGIVAIQRGEHSLVICLPAGLALLLLPTLLFYLDHRWYPRISEFVLDEDVLTYTRGRDPVPVRRRTDDVRWVKNRMHKGRTRGYLVKFHDGSGIFVCRSLTHADELARALRESISDRRKARA